MLTIYFLLPNHQSLYTFCYLILCFCHWFQNFMSQNCGKFVTLQDKMKTIPYSLNFRVARRFDLLWQSETFSGGGNLYIGYCWLSIYFKWLYRVPRTWSQVQNRYSRAVLH